ncbi:MAG: trypsin-like peptidase domain-containing protein, partial [Planctomycetales bacterium]|nr:trypsin-like peptidase domain-containing protein [Planctomycetales bacterium]
MQRSRPALALRVWTTTLIVLLAPLGARGEVSSLRMTPIVQAVKEAAPAVVNIQGQKSVPAAPGSAPGAEREVNGMGTGVVIDPRGFILTNYHVVAGVHQINVTMQDRRNYIAQIVAHDARTDLAVIKINAGNSLPTIRVGTSSDLMTGESVIAIGNAFGYEHTVTRGIISQLHRDVQVTDTQSYDDLIQTDASINPGNSGGP